MTKTTDGPRRVMAIDAADDVSIVIPLPRLCGSQEHAQEMLAGVHVHGGVVLVNGRDCSHASATVAAWFVDRLLCDPADPPRLRLRGCPEEFVQHCTDRARGKGVLGLLEVVSPPTRMMRQMRKIEPVVVAPGNCPRTFEGARCIHGYSRDELGFVVDDHMHLGHDNEGNRVEWLSGWQAPRFTHPHYRAWGIVMDALAVLLLLLGALIFGLGCVKGGGRGYWDLDTTTRILDGIVAGILVGIACRFMVNVAYLTQQWGPDPFKGRRA